MRQPMYPEVPPQIKPPIPPGLNILMNDLAKEVLRTNPEDIYKFCAQHFERLLKIRDGESPSEQVKLRKNKLKTKQNKRQEKSYEKIEEANSAEQKLDNFELEKEEISTVPELIKVITNNELRPTSPNSELTSLKHEIIDHDSSNCHNELEISKTPVVDGENSVRKEEKTAELDSEDESPNFTKNTENKFDEIKNEPLIKNKDESVKHIINTETVFEEIKNNPVNDLGPIVDKLSLKNENDASYDNDTRVHEGNILDYKKSTQSEIIDEHNHIKNAVEEENMTSPLYDDQIHKDENSVNTKLESKDERANEPLTSLEDQIIESIQETKYDTAENVSNISNINNSYQTVTINESAEDQIKLKEEANNTIDTYQVEKAAKNDEGVSKEDIEGNDEINNREIRINTDTEVSERNTCERKLNETIETVIIAETCIPHSINEQVEIKELKDIQDQISLKDNIADKELKEQIMESEVGNKDTNDVIAKIDNLNKNSKEETEEYLNDEVRNRSHSQNVISSNEDKPIDRLIDSELMKSNILKSEEPHTTGNLIEDIEIIDHKVTDNKPSERDNEIPKTDDENSGNIVGEEGVQGNKTSKEGDIKESYMVDDNVDQIVEQKLILEVDSLQVLHQDDETSTDIPSGSMKEYLVSNELGNQIIVSVANEKPENVTISVQGNPDTFSQLKPELELEVSKQCINNVQNKGNNADDIHDNGNVSKDVGLNENELDIQTKNLSSELSEMESNEDACDKFKSLESLPVLDGIAQLIKDDVLKNDEIINNNDNDQTNIEVTDIFLQSKPESELEVSEQYVNNSENKGNNAEDIDDNRNLSKDVNLNENELDIETKNLASELNKMVSNEDICDKFKSVGSLPVADGNAQLIKDNAPKNNKVINNNDNGESNTEIIIAEDAEDLESDGRSKMMQKFSDKNIPNLSMDMETAAITIQKVFRSFLFRSKSSNPDESIDGQHSETEDLGDRENQIFQTISELNLRSSEPLTDSNVVLSRMNSVLQTVNEEKSSLSTDESSDTLSSAATKIQAHIRGFLVRNKYNSNKTCNSSDTTAPSMGDDSKSLDDHSLNELPNEKQVIRITLTDPKLIESITDDSSFDGVNKNVEMTLRAQSSDRASEARKRLKREDAIQSISPFSSSETPTIIQATNKESGSDEQEKTLNSDEEANDHNKISSVLESPTANKNINSPETKYMNDNTIKNYPKTPALKKNGTDKNVTESSSEDQEWSEDNEFENPKILECTATPSSTGTLQQEQDEILQITITEQNNENIEGMSSDEMDVVTPKSLKSTPKYSHEKTKVHEMILKTADDNRNEKDLAENPGLVTTGEFHDVPLPTRVIRQNSSIVRGE